jgi:phage virion morphogenesis protein
MSGASITFTATDGSQIARHLARLASPAVLTAARREIGEIMESDVQDNFDRQRLFTGETLPQSAAARARAGKTLIAKHLLYDSYVSQPTDDGVVIGSNKRYAVIHHFGGPTGRGGRTQLPARPVLGVGDRQERKIGDFLLAQIESTQ